MTVDLAYGMTMPNERSMKGTRCIMPPCLLSSALVAALFGFTGIATLSRSPRFLFLVFLLLFVGSLAMGLMRRT